MRKRIHLDQGWRNICYTKFCWTKFVEHSFFLNFENIFCTENFIRPNFFTYIFGWTKNVFGHNYIWTQPFSAPYISSNQKLSDAYILIQKKSILESFSTNSYWIFNMYWTTFLTNFNWILDLYWTNKGKDTSP